MINLIFNRTNNISEDKGKTKVDGEIKINSASIRSKYQERGRIKMKKIPGEQSLGE